MKLALIGCGQWGRNLARVFYELGVLSMIVDPVTSFADDVLQAYPGVRMSAWESSPFEDPDITAVAIATPAITHHQIAIDAMYAGKDVFVEKPMAMATSSADMMLAAAEDNDCILMVGHIMEYHPAIQEMVRQVHAGELGDIKYIYANRLNNGRVRPRESVLWSFGPHDVAVLLRLMGCMPERVGAAGNRDSTVINLDWGEVKAHVLLSWVHPNKESQLMVVGSEKSLEFHHVYAQFGGLMEHRNGKESWIPCGTAEPLRLECQAFIDACETRQPPLTSGESGVRVLQVLEQAEMAMKSRERREEAAWEI